MYAQVQLIAMTPEAFLMDPISWLRNITKYRGSIAVAPNFAYHLCASRVTDEDVAQLDLSCLKAALNGAEPVDLRTLELFEQRLQACGLRDNVAFPVYGMAENCLAATFPRLGLRFEVLPMDRGRWRPSTRPWTLARRIPSVPGGVGGRPAGGPGSGHPGATAAWPASARWARSSSRAPP